MKRDNWGGGSNGGTSGAETQRCCFGWIELRCWNSSDIWAPALCPLHICRSDAPIVPRCCRLGQCEWSPGTESAVGASSGGHREVIGSRTCTTQLRVVINKTLSPYQPGSRTVLYDSLVPTDANGHIARHSANVNGVPTRRRMVSSRIASDYIGAQSGHRIG